MQQPIRVAMVDDHRLFALAVQSLFSEADGVRVVAIVSDPNEVDSILEEHSPDILLTDFSMPTMNGAELCKQVSKRFPAVKILCLTMHGEAAHIRKMIEAGASGYILKTAEKDEILTAFRTLAAGGQYFSPEVTTALAQPHKTALLNPTGALESLSKREIEVVKLIAQECTTQEIADKLFISARTVDSHRQNILEKIGVKNIAGITRFALENGLL